jgi:hypothetical protein
VGDDAYPDNGYAEQLLAWRHLYLLYRGKLTGLGSVNLVAGSKHRFQPGDNIPATQINNAGYDFKTETIYDVYGHFIRIGRPDDVANTLNAGALTTAQAMMLDKKLDDGLASKGSVMGQDGTLAGEDCTQDSGGAEVYIATETEEQPCSLVYLVKKL